MTTMTKWAQMQADVEFLSFLGEMEKDAQWALAGRALGGLGRLLGRLAPRAGGAMARAGGRMVASSPLRNLFRNVPRVLTGKPYLSPRNMAAGKTMVDPLGHMSEGATPARYRPGPARAPVPPLRPKYEGVTRVTNIRPQAPVDPYERTAYLSPASARPAPVDPLGRTGHMPPVTPEGLPVAESASLLPPPPTSMRVPVTPPIPGTPAYYQSSIASTGAALRQGQLQQSMADTLGPTGLSSAITPPSNPFQQIFHSLTSSPLLSKFNALVEPTVRRQA